MSATPIEWTERSWNPIVGCSVVSPGCTNCYAMRMAARIEAMAGDPMSSDSYRRNGRSHYDGTTRPSKAGAVWTGKVALAPESVLLAPLRRRKPTTWFVNSMGDLFHESVPDEWIDRVFAVMALSPQHTFQVLTKRSARMRAYMQRLAGFVALRPSEFLDSPLAVATYLISKNAGHRWPNNAPLTWWDNSENIARNPGVDIKRTIGFPPRNVWLGVSAEDQRRADERVPDLLATPAAIRFVSAEPLLGRIDFERLGNLNSIIAAMPAVIALENRGRPISGGGSICGAQIDAIGSAGSSITFFQTPDHMGGFTAASPRAWPRLDWIIVGGESGPGARPMHPDWARSIRDQCADAGVPFFFKQWGEHRPLTAAEHGQACGAVLIGNDPYDREAYVRRVGKKAAGRLLDGVQHDAMPARASA